MSSTLPASCKACPCYSYMFLHAACHQVPVTLQLLRAAFSSVPVLTHLLLVRHTELQPEAQPGLSAAFSKAMHSSSSGLWLYECSRRAVLPPLQVMSSPNSCYLFLHVPELWAAAYGRHISCQATHSLQETCSSSLRNLQLLHQTSIMRCCCCRGYTALALLVSLQPLTGCLSWSNRFLQAGQACQG